MLESAARGRVCENTDPDILNEAGHDGGAENQTKTALRLELVQILGARDGGAGKVGDRTQNKCCHLGVSQEERQHYVRDGGVGGRDHDIQLAGVPGGTIGARVQAILRSIGGKASRDMGNS